MKEKSRRWFQIHLSTAIVVMLVAGGFWGLNFVPNIGAPDVLVRPSARPAGYGWPAIAVRRHYSIALGGTLIPYYRWDFVAIIFNAMWLPV